MLTFLTNPKIDLKQCYVLLVLLMCGLQVSAQVINGDPELCTDGSQNTCKCTTAPILCSINELDGYTYEMSSFLHPDDGPVPMCPGQDLITTSQNPTWFAFYAWCEELSLEIHYTDCSIGPWCGQDFYGLQAAVYSDCSLDPSTAISCNTGVEGALNNHFRRVDMTDLIYGKIYYVLVDGYCGSACDVEVKVVGDCSLPAFDPWEHEIQGPDLLCYPVDETVTYTYPELHEGAEFYKWTMNGAFVGEGGNKLEQEISFFAPGTYEICMDVADPPCRPYETDPTPVCKTVVVIDDHANAGIIDGPVMCPGEPIQIVVNGFTNTSDYTNFICVVDENDDILYTVEGGVGEFAYEGCGELKVYSYNTYSGQGAQAPSVGENMIVYTAECLECYCDFSEGVLVWADDEDPEFKDIPVDITVECYSDLLPVGMLDYSDNCLGEGAVQGEEIGSHDDCTGGTYTRSWSIEDGCGNSATVSQNIVIEPIPPTVAIVGSESMCDGSTQILETDQVWASYEWSTQQNTQNISISDAGTYTVTVSDDKGCTAEASIEVSLNSNLEPSIIGYSAICEGGTTLLSVGQFASYTWSNGESGPEIEVSEAGEYSVVVVDDQGCSGEATITVTLQPNPEVTIVGSLSICDGGETELSVDGIFDSFSWSNGSASASILVNEAGTYSVEVVDEFGCTGVASVEVSLFDPIPFAISGNTDLCPGQTSVLSVDSDFQVVNWGDGSTDQTLVVTDAGTYSVTVLDSNGCEQSSDVIVTISQNLSPEITGIFAICEGGSTVLSTGDQYAQYEWSNGETSAEIVVTEPGDYSVTVTAATGCFGETQASVELSDGLTIEIAGDEYFCKGGENTLTVLGEYATYAWSNGESSQAINVTEPEVFSVTVTDANGCSGTASFETLFHPNEVINITGINEICEGDVAVLEISDNYSIIEWSTGETTHQIEVTEGGPYSAVVLDGQGCLTTVASEVIVHPLPQPQIEGELKICEGESTVLQLNDSFASVEWSDGSTGGSIEISEPTVVSLIATNDFGCSSETQVEVTVGVAPVVETVFTECDGQFISYTAIVNTNGVVDDAEGHYITFNGSSYIIPDIPMDESLLIRATSEDSGCQAVVEVHPPVCECPDGYIQLEAVADTFTVEYNRDIDVELITNIPEDQIHSVQWIPFVPGCFDCLENTFRDVKASVDYGVIITDVNGCVGEAEFRLNVFRDDRPFVPNILKSGHGVEGDFFPKTKDHDITVVQMIIFDRWGNEMFTNDNFRPNDRAAGWDLTYNGKYVENGVYMYFIHYDIPGQGDYFQEGDFTVVR